MLPSSYLRGNRAPFTRRLAGRAVTSASLALIVADASVALSDLRQLLRLAA